MEYIDRLIKNCQTAKKTRPVKEFELKKLSELDNIKQAIYIIEDLSSDIKKTFFDFSLFKKKKKENVPS